MPFTCTYSNTDIDNACNSNGQKSSPWDCHLWILNQRKKKKKRKTKNYANYANTWPGLWQQLPHFVYSFRLTARSPEMLAPARMPVAAGKKMAKTEKKVSPRKSGTKFSSRMPAAEDSKVTWTHVKSKPLWQLLRAAFSLRGEKNNKKEINKEDGRTIIAEET